MWHWPGGSLLLLASVLNDPSCGMLLLTDWVIPFAAKSAAETTNALSGPDKPQKLPQSVEGFDSYLIQGSLGSRMYLVHCVLFLHVFHAYQCKWLIRSFCSVKNWSYASKGILNGSAIFLYTAARLPMFLIGPNNPQKLPLPLPIWTPI